MDILNKQVMMLLIKFKTVVRPSREVAVNVKGLSEGVLKFFQNLKRYDANK